MLFVLSRLSLVFHLFSTWYHWSSLGDSESVDQRQDCFVFASAWRNSWKQNHDEHIIESTENTNKWRRKKLTKTPNFALLYQRVRISDIKAWEGEKLRQETHQMHTMHYLFKAQAKRGKALPFILQFSSSSSSISMIFFPLSLFAALALSAVLLNFLTRWYWPLLSFFYHW